MVRRTTAGRRGVRRWPTRPAVISLRPALVVLAAAACGPPALPAPYAVDRALVARRAATVDTLDVPAGADTLDLAVDLAVLRGRAGWALLDPAGVEAWAGTTTDDTTARHRTLAPAAGSWRFVLRPDSAVGTVSLRGSAR